MQAWRFCARDARGTRTTTHRHGGMSQNRSDKDIEIMVGTTQSAYVKRLENNDRVPPHLDDICAADAAIGGRKRGRGENVCRERRPSTYSTIRKTVDALTASAAEF